MKHYYYSTIKVSAIIWLLCLLFLGITGGMIIRHELSVIACMLLILLIGELRSYSRYYIAAKRRTPALSISAKYIFDHQSERKFYWNNIKSYELYSGLNRTVIYIDLKESSTRQDNTLAIPFISKLWLTLYNNTTNKFSISLLEDGNTIMQQLQAYEPEGQIMAQNL